MGGRVQGFGGGGPATAAHEDDPPLRPLGGLGDGVGRLHRHEPSLLQRPEEPHQPPADAAVFFLSVVVFLFVFLIAFGDVRAFSTAAAVVVFAFLSVASFFFRHAVGHDQPLWNLKHEARHLGVSPVADEKQSEPSPSAPPPPTPRGAQGSTVSYSQN
jgi:hypothetical protein